jgi:hypothetical protein
MKFYVTNFSQEKVNTTMYRNDVEISLRFRFERLEKFPHTNIENDIIVKDAKDETLVMKMSRMFAMKKSFRFAFFHPHSLTFSAYFYMLHSNSASQRKQTFFLFRSFDCLSLIELFDFLRFLFIDIEASEREKWCVWCLLLLDTDGCGK